jgi:hypothetical protein
MKKLTLMILILGMSVTSLVNAALLEEPGFSTRPIEEKDYHREGVEQKSLAMMAKDAAPEENVEHVKVGDREVAHTDFVEHQEKRALKVEEEELLPKKTFFTSHQGAFHRAIGVTFFGDQVTLEDGSVWTVSSWDRWKTLNWLTSDIILVMQNKWLFSNYKFMLVNQNTGNEVEVNMTLGPIYSGVFTHWIVAIDYFNCQVILEDGSVWNMDLFDSLMINKWMVNDTVIIGVNEERCLVHPNILINVNVLNYASGICIN